MNSSSRQLPSQTLDTLNLEAFRQEEISNEDYEFIRELIYNETRINLGDRKRELVSARLGKRLRALGMRSFGAYCRLLKNDPNTARASPTREFPSHQPLWRQLSLERAVPGHFLPQRDDLFRSRDPGESRRTPGPKSSPRRLPAHWPRRESFRRPTPLRNDQTRRLPQTTAIARDSHAILTVRALHPNE